MMPTFITIIEGEVMVWYEIINAKSDSYSADRDAEDMLRQLGTAHRPKTAWRRRRCFMV